MGMSEADTRAELIDPILRAKGWIQPYVKREESGKAVDIVNGQPRQRSTVYVDYVLRVEVNSHTQPVAVALLEAKAEDLPPDYGLEQAKAYTKCRRFNVPFIYASNGHLFVEYDRYTGLTSKPRPMAEFPARAEMRARYEQKIGFSLDDPAARPLITPYPGGEATRRYYQDAAIRAVLEKIVRCEKSGEPKRALLSLATGSGKTFIAVNLLKRIADAGQLRRALFVCDRDELRAQAHTHLQNVFGADAAEVYRKADGTNNAQNARIHIATYQTLGIDLPGLQDPAGLDANFLTTHYPPDYFSHIIIDECHRSAWGKWSLVLTRNPNAVQVGLTATPRQLVIKANTPEAEADAKITADNLKYFGEPVYEYDLAQGIEDGYLAACEIQKSGVDIDDTGITLDDVLARKPINARTGQPVTREELEELYNRTDYEDRIQLPDRVMAMCHDLFNHLLKTGGLEQKTVIFCVRDTHADAVTAEMNNLYTAWCAKNGRPRAEPYAFKCTAAGGGKDYLPDLRGSSRSHFIASTVELLTTGVDVPALRNVAFFRYMKSPISFYQMVGRGTRLDPGTGKLMFHVYDYTDATRLFGEDFFTKPTRPAGSASRRPGRSDDEDDEEHEEPLIISVEGFDVHISERGRYVVTMKDGRAAATPVEEYKAQLAERLKQEAPTLDDFRARWIDPKPRRAMVQKLVTAGYSPSLVRAVDGMSDYDLFDVLAKLTYRLPPQTRRQRADSFHAQQADWLKKLPARAAYTLTALTAQFARAGIEGLESTELFETGAVKKAGGLLALKEAGQPAELVRETKARLFA